MAITREIALTAANTIRADRISNKLTDDSARAVGSKRIGLAEEILGIQIKSPPPIVTPTAAFNINQTMATLK